MGKKPTRAEMIEVAQKRERLQARINTFHRKVSEFWQPNTDEASLHLPEAAGDQYLGGTDTEEEPDEDVFTASPLDDSSLVKTQLLLLPSSLGLKLCQDHGYTKFVKQEKILRTGQANDALQGIQLGLSKKAVIFWNGLRNAKTKTRKLRSWDQIVLVDINVRHHARVYNRARSAMVRLGATEEELQRYQVLRTEHLNVTTARIDPSLRGQRDSSLAWFWTMDVMQDAEEVEGMAKCK
jgi:hypothetical protein